MTMIITTYYDYHVGPERPRHGAVPAAEEEVGHEAVDALEQGAGEVHPDPLVEGHFDLDKEQGAGEVHPNPDVEGHIAEGAEVLYPALDEPDEEGDQEQADAAVHRREAGQQPREGLGEELQLLLADRVAPVPALGARRPLHGRPGACHSGRQVVQVV